MKTQTHLSRIGTAAIALFAAFPLHAQTVTADYSDTIGFGAMGGIILLLLTWTNKLRRQLRGGAAPAQARQQDAGDTEQEHEFLRALLKHASDCIYFKDRESRFRRCSKGMCDKHGVTEQECIGKTDFDLFEESHARDAFEDEQEILRTGQPLSGKVEREILRNGEERWALSAKWPLRDKHGDIIGTFGISKDITALKEAEGKLEQVHKQLVDASRMAGMAEVASTVLHNVGNVLNSVNVSASLVAGKVKNSKTANLGKAVQLMREHQDDLAGFLTNDAKGRQLPAYLGNLADHFESEERNILGELSSLCANVEHIKEIVAMQQAYSKISGVHEILLATDLMEDALRLNAGAVERHHVQVTREYSPVAPVLVDKHKVLQILVNLIRNAKYALDECGHTDKRMILRVEPGQGASVKISVIDNGVGIPAENLTRIFGHGFTTRKDGHGFGLHSGALAAKQLGGSLLCRSEGPGKGATFTLELPLPPETAKQ